MPARIDGLARGKSTRVSKYHLLAPNEIAASLTLSGTPLKPSTVNLTTGVPPNIAAAIQLIGYGLTGLNIASWNIFAFFIGIIL